MNEAILKSRLVKVIRKQSAACLVLRHEDKMTSGIPDISVTRQKKTIWLEVKYVNPYFHTKGIQEITVKRLATFGYCFYVLYTNINNAQFTWIVNPNDVVDGKILHILASATGHDHLFVWEFLKSI